MKPRDLEVALTNKSFYYDKYIQYLSRNRDFHFLSRFCNYQVGIDENLRNVLNDINSSLLCKYRTNDFIIFQNRGIIDFINNSHVIKYDPIDKIDWEHGFLYCIEYCGVILYHKTTDSFLIKDIGDKICFPHDSLEGLETFKQCAARVVNHQVVFLDTAKIYHEYQVRRSLYFVVQARGCLSIDR